MNQHENNPLSLYSFAFSMWRNRQLISQLTWREVVGRYQGSILGLAWSFFHPILLLAVYTFVFSVVFKARWNVASDQSNSQYAMIMFVGLIIYNLFAEVVNRAPVMVLANANYVKKVVFPLEILPITHILAALFHAIISILVLLTAYLIYNGFMNWTSILLPLILFPFLLLILGVALVIGSLGVYIRDVAQTIGIFTLAMMFLAPVVYPISAVPLELRPLMTINPLTFIIEQARAVLIWGELPEWRGLCIYGLVSLAVVWAGYCWFQKTRKGFADVL